MLTRFSQGILNMSRKASKIRYYTGIGGIYAACPFKVEYKEHQYETGICSLRDGCMAQPFVTADGRRILRRELELMYQTQGYSVNYVIEIRNFNEWNL